MKKHFKLIVFILALGIVFCTYKLFSKEQSKIIYIPLGDSIAEGMDSYSVVNYGYTDYIKDYLLKNNRLSFYTKKYAKSGYTIKDVIQDINNNKKIEEDNKTIYLKEILRESDLVTLTIGANDFINTLNLRNIESKIRNVEQTKKEADKIVKSLEELIVLIKKYAKNQIVVTGYYNPFPRVTEYKNEINEIVKYYNYLVEEICEDNNVKYIDIYDLFEGNEEYLPNPYNIHPNSKGYNAIAKRILESIE